MKTLTAVSMLLMGLIVASAGAASAQEQETGWTFRVTPYFVATAMDGDLTVNGHDAPVAVTFDNILENLEFGGMLHLMASKGPWSISVDGIYMGLGATSDTPPAEIDVDQWMVELAGSYRVTPWLDALAGARYNLISAEIDAQGRLDKDKSGDIDWVDPVVGARLTGRLSDAWTLRGRADIGGFGWTSDLTWQLGGYIDFRASELIAIAGGYRVLSNDYVSGSGTDLFAYDVTVSGPALGVSFIF